MTTKHRRTPRYRASFRVTTETIDAVRDPVTGEPWFHSSEEDRTVDLSRLGLRLRAVRAPSVGTRLVLRLHTTEGAPPLEFIARTRWTKVESEPGPDGMRAVCGVGVELLGGPRGSLDQFELLLTELDEADPDAVAGDRALG